MSYVFLVPKKSIRGQKMSFLVIFRFISGEIFAEKNFEHFYSTKRFVFEFQVGCPRSGRHLAEYGFSSLMF